jgi:uncharacterized membrane protein YqjE
MARASGDLREQSTGDLVKDLSEQVSALVRQEVALAKAEMTEKGKKAGLGAGLFSFSVVSALMAIGALTAFLILLLELAMPAWAAALCVTALWAAVAAAAALWGREKFREVGTPVPEEAVESVKEDVQWLKERTKSETT